jgi:hypothetical protein
MEHAFSFLEPAQTSRYQTAFRAVFGSAFGRSYKDRPFEENC